MEMCEDHQDHTILDPRVKVPLLLIQMGPQNRIIPLAVLGLKGGDIN